MCTSERMASPSMLVDCSAALSIAPPPSLGKDGGAANALSVSKDTNVHTAIRMSGPYSGLTAY